MSFTTDHTFHIGEQHSRNGKPNQDYALSGTFENGLAYIIVSDGCSSGGLTDIGSRLMVLATKQALVEISATINPFENPNAIELVNQRRDTLLEQFRRALDLEYQDLLATCLWAISSSEFTLVNLTGDGIVAIQTEAGLTIEQFEWDKNMPYYPAYRLNQTDSLFIETHGDEPYPFRQTRLSEESGEYCSPKSTLEGMSGWSVQIESSKLISLALFTDGVEQIDSLGYKEAVERLMAFKSTSGQFAVRRMNRFLKEVNTSGRGAIDDISYAVINFDES